MTFFTLVASLSGLLAGHGDLQGLDPAVGPPDPVGVYRVTGGSLVGVRASGEGRLRYIDFATGESHAMYPSGPDEYHSASDWGSETPVALTYRFSRGPDGAIRTLRIESTSGGVRRASRVRLRTRSVDVHSGDVRLRGRLVLPSSGEGPHPVVVYVHGSGRASAVDTRVLPYYWAANGIAGFVFDKRGTGESEGSYTQLFEVLASDVVAAADRIKEDPEIDARRVGLAGFSQGGWVAPLAASRDSTIRYAFIGYGLAMPVAEEDRLEAPEKLRALGFEGEAIAEFEDLNAVLHEIARAGFPEAGWERLASKIEEYQGREWMAAIRETQTWAGQLLTMGLDRARQVVPQMFESFIDPFYDPVPTLEVLEIPMMWVIAEEDIEAPPGPTIDVMKRLRDSGKPFELAVFPGTDHGMTTFEGLPSGGRIETGYAPGYYCTMMAWLRRQALAERRIAPAAR